MTSFLKVAYVSNLFCLGSWVAQVRVRHSDVAWQKNAESKILCCQFLLALMQKVSRMGVRLRGGAGSPFTARSRIKCQRAKWNSYLSALSFAFVIPSHNYTQLKFLVNSPPSPPLPPFCATLTCVVSLTMRRQISTTQASVS